MTNVVVVEETNTATVVATPTATVGVTQGDLTQSTADARYVALTGNQAVAGVKTFSSAPVVPTNAFPETAVTALVSDLAGKSPTSHTHSGTTVSRAGGTTGTQEPLTYINVKDYGALGDGTTDDRTAILAAQTALTALGGGILWFPKGTYMVSAPMAGATNIVWAGAGRGISILKATAGFPNTAATGLLRYGGVFGAGVDVTNIGVRDLGFDMTAAPDTVVNRINAIYQDFGQVTHARFSNLAFDLLLNGQGILLGGLGASPGTESFDIVFEDIYGHNGAGTISTYLNARAAWSGPATFSTSTYHSVKVDGCFNLVDLPGIVDDRVVIVGAQTDNANGVPTANTVIRGISVQNVYVKMTSAVTSGLVHGVKLDTGRYCNLTDVTVRNVFFIGNGLGPSGSPVIFLMGTGAGGTTTGIQDIEIDGVYGTQCGPIKTSFNRFANQPSLSIRNVSLDSMKDPNLGIEVYCPGGPTGDALLVIDGVSLHSTVSQGAHTPVGILLTGGTTGQGQSGKISISRVSLTGFKTGVSNNVADAGTAQATAWTNIVVRDCNLTNSAIPLDLINSYEVRSCTGLDDLIVGNATFSGTVTFSAAPSVPSNSFPESAVTNLTTDLAAKATDSLAVHLAGIETITGVKTFSANPVLNAGAIPESAVANLTTDLAAKATDTLTVHLAGIETITGAKTFSTAPVVPALSFPPTVLANLRPTAALAETTSRVQTLASLGTLLSGRLHLVGIDLPSGLLIASITFVAGATGAGSPTNQWFALFNNAASPVLLRQTSDDLTTAWSANAAKALTLSSSFTTTYSGLHYLGIMVAAGTVPTLMGVNGNTTITQLAPCVSGLSTTGLTTPGSFSSPAAAPTALSTGQTPYAYVS